MYLLMKWYLTPSYFVLSPPTLGRIFACLISVSDRRSIVANFPVYAPTFSQDPLFTVGCLSRCALIRTSSGQNNVSNICSDDESTHVAWGRYARRTASLGIKGNSSPWAKQGWRGRRPRISGKEESDLYGDIIGRLANMGTMGT